MIKKLLIAVLLLSTWASAQNHSVALTWTDSTDTGSTYNIYRANADCSTNPTFSNIASAAAGATSFTDSTVAPGKFCYRLTAVLNGLESLPSNTVNAVVLPSPPTGLTETVIAKLERWLRIQGIVGYVV